MVLLAVGLASFGLALWRGDARVERRIASLERVLAPGEVTFSVKEPGRQTIFYEYRGRYEDRGWKEEDRNVETPVEAVWPQRHEPAMRVTVAGPFGSATPVEVELLADRTVLVYQRPAGSGYGVWSFDAPASGPYRLDAEWIGDPPSGLDAKDHVLLAIGRWDAEPWSREMWYAAAVLAFCFTGAVVAAVVTWMLRAGHVTPRGEMRHVRRLG